MTKLGSRRWAASGGAPSSPFGRAPPTASSSRDRGVELPAAAATPTSRSSLRQLRQGPQDISRLRVWLAVDNSPNPTTRAGSTSTRGRQIRNVRRIRQPGRTSPARPPTSSATRSPAPRSPASPRQQLQSRDGRNHVDTEGNIWAVNQEQRELDEFGPSRDSSSSASPKKAPACPQFEARPVHHGFGGYPGRHRRRGRSDQRRCPHVRQGHRRGR